jgi:hypothetical protein
MISIYIHQSSPALAAWDMKNPLAFNNKHSKIVKEDKIYSASQKLDQEKHFLLYFRLLTGFARNKMKDKKFHLELH